MIGLLRKRIDLLTPVKTEDAAGGAAYAWESVETLWAGLNRLTSVRDLSGEGDRRLKRFAATIRFRADIAPGGRVRFEGADYVVASVEGNDAREKQITLVCEEIPS